MLTLPTLTGLSALPNIPPDFPRRLGQFPIPPNPRKQLSNYSTRQRRAMYTPPQCPALGSIVLPW
jgi:hypothetical protein